MTRVGALAARGARAILVGALATVAPALPASLARAATPLPRVLVCSGTPVLRPTSLHWCTSSCSSYLRNIHWTLWTATRARGVAVRMTNNGVPTCAQGTWTAHPGWVVTLSDPKVVPYCAGTVERRALLFTRSDYSAPYALPMMPATCA